MPKTRPLTGNDVLNNPALLNRIGAEFAPRKQRDERAGLVAIGNNPIKGTPYASAFSSSELNVPTTRDKTQEQLREELMSRARSPRENYITHNGNITELKKLATDLGIPLEEDLSNPVHVPRKMTPEEQDKANRESAEYLAAEEVEKERQRAEKERIALETKLAKEEERNAALAHDLSINPPRTEQEAKARKENVFTSQQRLQELMERRDLVRERENERLEAQSQARERNKASAAEQLKRLQAQENQPLEEIDKTVKAVEDANVVEISGAPRYAQEAHKAKVLAALRNFKQPYEQYLGQNFADETPEQLTSQIRVHELDPSQGETLREYNELKSRLENIPSNPAMNATQPYLKRDRSLLEAHRGLVGAEEDEMEKIYRQRAMEHLEEDILPKIRDKYAIPGVRHHGHMARDEDRAIRNYSRELNNSLNDMRLKNKQITIPATLAHQGNQLKEAQLAQTAGVSDAQHEMDATKTLKSLQDSHYAHKDKFAATLGRLGDVKQQKNQAILDLEKEEFYKRHGYNDAKLGVLSNILAAHPVTTATSSTGTLPGKVWKSPESTAGQMMAAQGANFMPKESPFKKGGRVKKAIGGTLNPIDPIQDAINWSVIDRESPMDELKRDVRRQRAMGMMNMMKNRRAYAIGGGVSPIEQGAAIAEGISYKEKLKRAKEKALEQAERDQIQTEQPMLTGALKTMSRAAARQKTPDWMEPNWLQGIGTAVSGTFEDRDAEAAAFRAQRQAAIDRQLKMAEGEEASERDARDYGLKERVAESNIAHHRAMEEIGRMSKTKDLSQPTEKELGEIKKDVAAFEAAEIAEHQRKVADEALGSVSTGGFLGSVSQNPYLGGSYSASALSKIGSMIPRSTIKASSPEQYQTAESQGEALVNKIKDLDKQITSTGRGSVADLMHNIRTKQNTTDPANVIKTKSASIGSRFSSIQEQAISDLLRRPHGLVEAQKLLQKKGMTVDDFVRMQNGGEPTPYTTKTPSVSPGWSPEKEARLQQLKAKA